MIKLDYEIIRDFPDHLKLQNQVTLELWPEFMLQDPVASNWFQLFEHFPEFQFSLKADGEVIGTANSIPIFWDKPLEDLPEEGWDWVYQKGFKDRENNLIPNTLAGLQIAVNKKYQGRGVSTLVLKEMLKIARENSFEQVIIPIRPSLKSKYPLIPIDNYLDWQREKDGQPFDPWLRVHLRAGGEVIKVCHKAMYIPGAIKEWEEWTGLKFKESGDYIIKGALNPVKIDLENDIGEYIEPNIWIHHQVAELEI